jgi:hypothetical protein
VLQRTGMENESELRQLGLKYPSTGAEHLSSPRFTPERHPWAFGR